MLKRSIVMTALVVGVLGLAAVAWAGMTGPGPASGYGGMMRGYGADRTTWAGGPGYGGMMGGDGSDQGPWDRGWGDDMAAWMEQMHGPDRPSGDLDSWDDMVRWMEEAWGPDWQSRTPSWWDDMARWMQETWGPGPGTCPYWRFPSPAGDAPVG